MVQYLQYYRILATNTEGKCYWRLVFLMYHCCDIIELVNAWSCADYKEPTEPMLQKLIHRFFTKSLKRVNINFKNVFMYPKSTHLPSIYTLTC